MFGVFQNLLQPGRSRLGYREVSGAEQEFAKSSEALQENVFQFSRPNTKNGKRLLWWIIGSLAGIAVFVAAWYSWSGADNFLPQRKHQHLPAVLLQK